MCQDKKANTYSPHATWRFADASEMPEQPTDKVNANLYLDSALELINEARGLSDILDRYDFVKEAIWQLERFLDGPYAQAKYGGDNVEDGYRNYFDTTYENDEEAKVVHVGKEGIKVSFRVTDVTVEE